MQENIRCQSFGSSTSRSIRPRQKKGCISEKLLRCKDAHEFISYSEWDSEADIAAYTNGDAHKEIVRHARALKGSKAVVKLYELVQ